VTAVLASLADLVLPRHCLGCGAPGTGLCAACVPRQPPHPVPAGLPVLAAASYDGAVRSALLAYKERGRRDLAGCLADLLARCVVTTTSCVTAPCVLVPVPSARDVARGRGGDHMLRLARATARRCPDTRVVTPLRLARSVRDSAGLGASARAANLHGALRASAPRYPAGALLVDDIVTTGATLREAARALTSAGWQVSGAAVIAATQRR
jgi:predicted amidophosphoribosyltransferase